MTATKNAERSSGDSAPTNLEETILENELSFNSYRSEEEATMTPAQGLVDETGDAKPLRSPNLDCSNSNCVCCAKAQKAENEDFDHLLNESFEETPLLTSVVTIIGYGVLVVFGYLRDWLRRYGFEAIYSAKEPNRGPGMCSTIKEMIGIHAGLEKLPFYSPFASGNSIWRVNLQT